MFSVFRYEPEVGSMLWFKQQLYAQAPPVMNFVMEHYILVFVMCYSLFLVKHFGFWWRKPFEGMRMHVREPRVGWVEYGKQGKYEFKIGDNVFLSFLFAQISCFNPVFETVIHKMVSHQDDCAGLIKQELNHGMLHVLMNKDMEAKWGYPCSFWTRVYSKIFNSVPAWLTRSFLAALEANFICFSAPIVEDIMLRTKFHPFNCWAMHSVEESEHTWQSVKDIAGEMNLLQRIGGCIFLQIYITFLAIPSFFTSFYYGWRELFLHGRIFKDTIVFCVLMFFLMTSCMLVQLCNYILLMELRPEAYHHFNDVTKGFLAPYVDEWRITHVQKPDGELATRKSFAVDKNGKRIKEGEETGQEHQKRMSVYIYQKQNRMSIHGGNLDIKRRQSLAGLVAPLKEDPRILALRTVTYETAKHQLQKAGLKENEVKDLFMEDPELLKSLTDDDKQKHLDKVNPKQMYGLKLYTVEDVKIDGAVDGQCLVIIRGMVLDLAPFCEKHPGGPDVLKSYAGRDASLPFSLIHQSKEAKNLMHEYVVGRIVSEHAADGKVARKTVA